MSPQPAPTAKLFDLGTINLGHLLTIGVIAAGLIGSYYLNGFRLELLEKKSDRIEAKLDGFTATVIEAAVTKQRLTEYERRLALIEQHR
jgi:hypothetical protein